ncbi:MAG: RagB/SusD family nutrient uptake outer membrane protein [Tannerellaceae bacterium]|jgi:hypothetical protein|nr:RagB/SusD family nutrient uptake outer membrane protein [Tannerellaceae bacterium]
MKNIRIIGFFLLCGLCGLAFFSCKDFLYEDPKGKLNEETFFSTNEDLQMSLHALFHRLMYSGQATNFLSYAWAGDDITTHDAAANKQTYREFDRYSPSNIGYFEGWGIFYSVAKAANFVINYADKTPTSQTNIEQAIAQARFWRAYAYYILVRVWGPIPVTLESEVRYDTPLSSVEEVYKVIIEDLQYAESHLPSAWTTAPQHLNGTDVYVTDGGAKAMLAHVYLTMGGWPLKQQDKYALARDKAKEVIDGVQSGKYYYQLHPNFADVYKLANNFSKEDIISIHYNKDWGYDENSMSSQCGLLGSTGVGWDDYYGEIKFWKDMPDGPRKDAIYSPKVWNKAANTVIDWWETPERHPQIINMAEGPNRTEYDYAAPHDDLDWLGEKTHKIFRYSELLLTYAEAQARADGAPNALAYDCINQVRNRAGLDDLPAGLSGSDFADAALAEHGWEVAGFFWGNIACRFFDMQRMELLKVHFEYRKANPGVEVAGQLIKEVITVEGTWNDDRAYAPYPAEDTALNPNLVR